MKQTLEARHLDIVKLRELLLRLFAEGEWNVKVVRNQSQRWRGNKFLFRSIQ